MEVDELQARAAVKDGKCDGNCEAHRGEVRLVTIESWGYFAYCEAAIEEDRSRGLVVETA